MTSAGGEWRPSQAISYGVAISSFQPVQSVQPPTASEASTVEPGGDALVEDVDANPHQVSWLVLSLPRGLVRQLARYRQA